MDLYIAAWTVHLCSTGDDKDDYVSDRDAYILYEYTEKTTLRLLIVFHNSIAIAQNIEWLRKGVKTKP